MESQGTCKKDVSPKVCTLETAFLAVAKTGLDGVQTEDRLHL